VSRTHAAPLRVVVERRPIARRNRSGSSRPVLGGSARMASARDEQDPARGHPGAGGSPSHGDLIGAIESSVEPAVWSPLVAALPAGPGTCDVIDVPAATTRSATVGCGLGAGCEAPGLPPAGGWACPLGDWPPGAGLPGNDGCGPPRVAPPGVAPPAAVLAASGATDC